MKIIVCWTSRLYLLEDLNIDSLYIFIIKLVLIYPTLDPNLFLTLI